MSRIEESISRINMFLFLSLQKQLKYFILERKLFLRTNYELATKSMHNYWKYRNELRKTSSTTETYRAEKLVLEWRLAACRDLQSGCGCVDRWVGLGVRISSLSHTPTPTNTSHPTPRAVNESKVSMSILHVSVKLYRSQKKVS